MNHPFHAETACSLAKVRLRIEIHRLTQRAQLATVVEFAQARARLGVGPAVLSRAGCLDLPEFIRCPECGAHLAADVFEHNVDTGVPDTFGVHLCCTALQEELAQALQTDTVPVWNHHFLPLQWAGVNRLAAEWLHRNVRIAP
ncbi:hypothetical protein [Pseudacidovorax intermedius]|uniref:Uncharacterized protein n=1 Tax=Pseudacidovorax intermedius TaxID=433924 RepID=A0A147GW89_9BURK|nr:hypothetical protein [Pseudacidovorax intermedius]KTT21881.1 hypothetical protein NS331_10985 [Pseudacidovorax intermedius]